MDEHRIAYLHDRYLTNTLSPDEAIEWQQLLTDPRHEAAIKSLMQSTWKGITAENQQDLPADKANAIFRQVTQAPYIRRIYPWLRIAAAFVAVLTIGYFVFDMGQNGDDRVLVQADIPPGGNKATLTLADGRVIDLSEEQSGIIVGDEITYTDGSAIASPEVGPSATEEGNRNTLYAILTTPKGGIYQVTLSDGTKVWLNSASTLKYPNRFTGNERVVELEGEAYFEVSHQLSTISYQPNVGTKPKADSRQPTAKRLPFRVVSRGQTVEVLGTQFNILAYPDEPNVKTTLVEGSVRVVASGIAAPNFPTSGIPDFLLKPSQQSILADGRIEIKDVDPRTELAWRNGRFNFDGKKLPQVMRELSRWYAIDVAYEGQVPDIEFFGGIHRNNNLATVMNILETNGIGYRLTPDSTLILSPIP